MATITNKAVLAKVSTAGKATQAPPANRDGSRYGLKTGLMLTHCCNALFAANETAKAADPELQEWLRGEYPNRTSMQAVSALRSYYNKALHGFGSGAKGAKQGLHSNSYGRLTAAARTAFVVTNPRETAAPAPKGKAPKGKAPKGKAPKGKAAPRRKAAPKRKAAAK